MKTFSKQHISSWLKNIFALGFLILISITGASAQTIRYVKKDATGTNDGTSWGDAYAELADALKWAKQNAALWTTANPLQLWVAAGTYSPKYSPEDADNGTNGGRRNSFELINNVQLYGGFTGEETSIANRNWNTNKTVLSGDLGNGQAYGQAYQVVFSIGTASNPISPNTLLDGFTVANGRADNFGNTVIHELNLSRRNGGGIYLNYANVTIVNTIVRESFAASGGGIACYSSSPAITNVLITQNSGPNASALGITNSSPVFTNVTIARNLEGRAIETSNSTAQFHNCIVFDNNWENYLSAEGTGFLIAKNSLIQGITSDDADGNIGGSNNPMFTDAANGNFSLQLSSPAINRGSNNFYAGGQSPDLSGTTKDLAGNSRKQGRIDIGAYEVQDLSSIATRYVRQGGSGNGYSWSQASGDIQAMINESTSGNEVWVAKGEYQPAVNHSFSMKEGVKIYGGFAAIGTPALAQRNWSQNVTTLRGNGSSVIVNNDNGLTNAALLDGFTITGGAGIYGGGVYNRLSYPTINHCIFHSNEVSSWGGGIYNEGAGTTIIANSLFYDNQAQSGGVAFSNLSATPKFINVTMADNRATENAGAVHNFQGASTELVNSIVWGNTQLANSGQLLTLGQGENKVSFSVLEGGSEAIIGGKTVSDNISFDPLFVNPASHNYNLLTCSPAINLGSADAVTDFTTDLTGKTRIFNNSVDAGADEVQSLPQTGANRLAVNGNVTTVDVTPGQTYHIQVAGDACRSIFGIESKGNTPVAGNVTVTTRIENSFPTHNGISYVQRHYAFSPDVNESTATARITLYFSQEEFTAFNSHQGSDILPVGSSDGSRLANIRVYQFHGVPTGGFGPGNYERAAITLTPDVKWNTTANYWELSFDVSGFSGFFVGGASTPLPVKLVSFTGKQTDSKSVSLQWQVTDQVHIDKFVVEYSRDARKFEAVGTVEANELLVTTYEHEDVQPHTGKTAYYRLRILENDGSFAFSRIASVGLGDNNDVIIYPIPAGNVIWIKGADISGNEVQIINKAGVVMKTVRINSDTQQINLSSLAPGMYLIGTTPGTFKTFIKE